MKYNIIFMFFLTFFTFKTSQALDESEIHGYHFHTYFFQTKIHSLNEAKTFKEATQDQINQGQLKSCIVKKLHEAPVGPHALGSFETCCNASSISRALSWFMLNHGNLTVLLHPLTRWELVDHTDRAMFLGPSHNIDLSVLSLDLEDNIDLCIPS